MALLKKSNVPAVRLSIIIGSLGLIVAAAIAFWFTQTPSAPDKQVVLSYRLTVTNTTNKPIKDTGISFASPVLHTAYQECRDLKVNYEHAVKDDDLGNHYISMGWKTFPPFGSKIVVVKSVLDTWRSPRKIKANDLAPYTKPEAFIESNDSGIVELASNLKRGSAMETARATYQWVSEHITYSNYVKRPRGAAYALAHKKGDCTEFACLFAALCRANGIPARVVSGLVCPRDMVADMADYHDWAEFYAKGRWTMADPQEKVFGDNDKSYIVFTIRESLESDTGLLVSDVKGDGLTVKFK